MNETRNITTNHEEGKIRYHMGMGGVWRHGDLEGRAFIFLLFFWRDFYDESKYGVISAEKHQL
jgi:hypothetical protein